MSGKDALLACIALADDVDASELNLDRSHARSKKSSSSSRRRAQTGDIDRSERSKKSKKVKKSKSKRKERERERDREKPSSGGSGSGGLDQSSKLPKVKSPTKTEPTISPFMSTPFPGFTADENHQERWGSWQRGTSSSPPLF